ncbi:MAG TPA: hypothetical protein PK095_10220, partial [Myxococcota bacterium]|nr:hypothetical protein [Myxococcota bacterium]
MAELVAPTLPLELVRKLAWPRLEVFQVVRGLAQSARLDTPRAGFDRLAPSDGAFYLYADVAGLTDDSR